MHLTLLSPGDPAQRTGGYLYNARLTAALRAVGHRVDVVAVEGPWPGTPAGDPLPRGVGGDHVLADGLLWTGLAPYATAWSTPVTVLVHSPLAAEAPHLRDTERAALAGRRVLCTGGPAQRDLAAMGIPATLLAPGTDPAPRTVVVPGRGHLVALCTLTPRKRLVALLDALAGVPGAWTLTVAGSLDRDPVEAERVRARAAAMGARVRLVGELDDDGVAALLAEADLLVHAAAYEAWGMAISEALARGVPVVCTPAGAAEAGGAQVVPLEGLGAAVGALLADPIAHARAADRAWAHGRSLPTWDRVAQGLLAALGGP